MVKKNSLSSWEEKPSVQRFTNTDRNVVEANISLIPPVPADCECLIAAVTSIGKLLVFEAEELPELAKGKGNKIIGIPSKKYKEGEEKLVAVAVIAEEGNLQVLSGARRMTIKWDDLDDYYYERGRRGNLLPQGWRKVERLAAE